MPDQSTCIFLDIDRTLFDTERWGQDLNLLWKRHHFNTSLINTCISEVEYDCFSWEKLANHIKKADSLFNTAEFIQITVNQNTDLSSYLFPDVIHFLQWAYKKAHIPFLITYGDPQFQYEFKIHRTGLEKWIPNAQQLFTDQKFSKGPVIKKALQRYPSNSIVFIDDKEKELASVKAYLPKDNINPLHISLYQINRYTNKPLSNFPTIFQLKELQAKI